MADPENASTPRAPLPHLQGLSPGALMQAAAGPDTSSWPTGFEYIRPIGAGGMGEVYLARETMLDRLVAVKIVPAGAAGEPAFLERLGRARLMSSIHHPGIAVIHRFEELGNGGAAIIMEYISGGNLREWMQAQRGPAPLAEAVRIARDVAEAIQAAHGCGIVHRDLKPENILLCADGRAKVTDFGLAVPQDPEITRLTLAGTTAGTADYMAPERLDGHDTDPRGDIYSLG